MPYYDLYVLPHPASGEHTGYTFIDRSALAFHIRCITHRKNPIRHDLIDQFPPSESSVGVLHGRIWE